MDKLKIDIKTVITLAVFIFTAAGFYYKTDSQLKTIPVLESKLEKLEKKVTQLQRRVNNLTKKKHNKSR